LWFYDTIYKRWNDSKPLQAQDDVNWPAYGASTVTDESVAYYHGGWLNENTTPGWRGDPLMLNTLLSYDMMADKWTNHTLGDNIPRAEGTLTYLPVSDRGMLVHMGGLETTSSATVTHVCSNDAQILDSPY
jgi:hypothetical protein